MGKGEKTSVEISGKRIAVILIVAVALAAGIYIASRYKNEENTAMTITTPFVDLEYPAIWEEQLKVEWKGIDVVGNMVFSAKIQDKAEKEIFTIHFNNDAHRPIGILRAEDGSDVYVGYSLATPLLEENWSKDEKEMLYAMQEDVNFIIQQLAKNERFTVE